MPALVTGLAGAGAIAVLASPLLTVGLARRADPDVGLHADWIVLGPGLLAGLAAAGAVVVFGLLAAVTGRSAARIRSAGVLRAE